MLARNKLIWMAVMGNVIVAATTYALRGWNAAGAHAAARNTARFSVLWFMVGFAAPGLVHLQPEFFSPPRLMQAFFSAHLVHFVTVAALLMTFEGQHITQHPGQAVLVILFGAGLTFITGLTATPRPSQLYTVAHRIALYAVFLIFFLAFAHHPAKPLRLFAVGLGVALLCRLSSLVPQLRARSLANLG